MQHKWRDVGREPLVGIRGRAEEDLLDDLHALDAGTQRVRGKGWFRQRHENLGIAHHIRGDQDIAEAQTASHRPGAAAP